jgi:beta-lactamase regulating signal transducer with metallopeptidase domain
MSALFDHILMNAALATLLTPVAYASRWLGQPILTHALWLVVLIRLVVPPAWCVHWSTDTIEPPLAETAPLMTSDPPPLLDESFAEITSPSPITESERSISAEPVMSWSMPWRELTLGIWILVAVMWWTRLAFHAVRFQRLLQFAAPTDPATQQLVAKLARRLGLRHAPRVVMVPTRISPCVWCFGWLPVLLLPQDWTLRQTRLQRAAVLVHELAHLRRGDHWVRWFELFVAGWFWWLPTMWLARHYLREAEELCCDGWVVATLPAARQAYATALVDMADYLAPLRPALPPLASGFGQVHELRRRLHMILHAKPAIRAGRSGAAIALGLGLFLLPIGIDRSPTALGQEPRPERERRDRDDPPPERTERDRDRDRERAAEERARDRARAAEERERATTERERAVEVRNREANRREGVQAELRAELAAAQRQLVEAQRAVERIRARMSEIGMDITMPMESTPSGGRGGSAPRVSEPIRGGGGGGGRGGSVTRDTPALEGRGGNRVPEMGGPPIVPTAPPPPPTPPREPMAPIPPRVGGRTTAAPSEPSGPRNADERVQQLERQLDALRRELEALRREMRRDGDRRPDNRPPQDGE